MEKISGVYKITNTITGDFYIGSSIHIKRRWSQHKSPYMQIKCPRSKIYKDIVQYGLDSFLFEVIEETDNFKEREQYWISQLKPSYNNYNASGIDNKRKKETQIRSSKAYYKSHREESSVRAKAYYKSHREERRARNKAYIEAHKEEYSVKRKSSYSRLCLYENETLTLNALTARFREQGITHAYIEAKKYLL